MRFNDRETAQLASLPSDHEGRLNHKESKGSGHRDVYRERWFKLKGNLLFYYRLNEFGAVAYADQPQGAFVIEQCQIQLEPLADLPFSFSMVFTGEPDRKHYLSATTQPHCEQWVRDLSRASYGYLRDKLRYLRETLIGLTGEDPLRRYGTGVQLRPAETTGSTSSHARPPKARTAVSAAVGNIPRNRSVPSTVWLLD